MDNREVALELLKLFLQTHRERVELPDLVDAYLYIYNVLEGKEPVHGEAEGAQPQQAQQQSDDSLFDFKEPISLSDKEA